MWKLTCENLTSCLRVIYHPLSSEDNTITKFTDELCELLNDISASQVNIIILGGFNIHVNDENDLDVIWFIDTMEALGLKQYINKLTHKIGKTLDLILKEGTLNIRVDKIEVKDLVSDHRWITLEMDITKPTIVKTEKSFRKLSEVEIDKFVEDMHMEELNDKHLDELIDHMNRNVTKSLDIHATLKTVKIKSKEHLPW